MVNHHEFHHHLGNMLYFFQPPEAAKLLNIVTHFSPTMFKWWSSFPEINKSLWEKKHVESTCAS